MLIIVHGIIVHGIMCLVKVHYTSITQSSQLKYQYITVVSQAIYWVTAIKEILHQSITVIEYIAIVSSRIGTT